MQGIFSGDQTSAQNNENIVGNSLIIAENSTSSFKLKYAMINHGYSFSVE
jgi:hypothetical protein